MDEPSIYIEYLSIFFKYWIVQFNLNFFSNILTNKFTSSIVKEFVAILTPGLAHPPSSLEYYK